MKIIILMSYLAAQNPDKSFMCNHTAAIVNIFSGLAGTAFGMILFSSDYNRKTGSMVIGLSVPVLVLGGLMIDKQDNHKCYEWSD